MYRKINQDFMKRLFQTYILSNAMTLCLAIKGFYRNINHFEWRKFMGKPMTWVKKKKKKKHKNKWRCHFSKFFSFLEQKQKIQIYTHRKGCHKVLDLTQLLPKDYKISLFWNAFLVEQNYLTTPQVCVRACI